MKSAAISAPDFLCGCQLAMRRGVQRIEFSAPRLAPGPQLAHRSCHPKLKSEAVCDGAEASGPA